MKFRIAVMVVCGLLVSILSARASVTEQQLRSAQSRLGMVGGKYSVAIIGGAPNAGAYPDGRIVFTSGMMQLAADEDEAAAVLAHEKTHVDQRHGARQQKETLLFGLLGYGIARVAGVSGKEATVAGIGVAALRHQRFSLRDEYRADEGSVKALFDAGYRSDALSTLFARMGGQSTSASGGEGLCFAGLPTHPSFQARQTAMRRQLEQLPQRPVGKVGAMLVAIENRLRYYGQSGFTIWTRSGRIRPNGVGGDVSALITPAQIDALVQQGFDVVESERIEVVFTEQNARFTGRFDESTLAQIGKLVGASHILVVALIDDRVNSTGNVEVALGKFGRTGVEAEAAQRRIKLSARLIEVETRVIPWTSAKVGTDAALAGSYANFGFFNGVRAEAATASNNAVEKATKRIAEQLRKDVAPAAPEPKPKEGLGAPEPALDVTPDPKPAAAEKPDCWFPLYEGFDVDFSTNKTLFVYRGNELVGEIKPLSVKDRKVYCITLSGEGAGPGKEIYRFRR